MLTLEQIAEGQRLLAAADAGDVYDAHAAQEWLLKHAAELLDAAERVARQEAYAAEPDGYDRADTSLGRLDPHMVKTMASRTDAQLLANELLAREARASARLDGETHCIDEEPEES